MSTLVVLAAGLATRYGGAKQLEAVGPSGETLFDYAVWDALVAGCTDVLFVIREELRPLFLRDVLPRWRRRAGVRLAVQEIAHHAGGYAAARAKPWGTAHALLVAAAQLESDALVCNADDFYGRGAYQALAPALLPFQDAHAVAGYRLADTLSAHGGVSRAVCVTDQHGRLRRVEERTGVRWQSGAIRDERGATLPPAALVSMNLWAFRRSFFAALPGAFEEFLRQHGRDPLAEFRIPDVVNELVRQGERVRAVPVAERWFGMTYPADLAPVRAAIAARIRAGEYPDNLFAAE